MSPATEAKVIRRRKNRERLRRWRERTQNGHTLRQQRLRDIPKTFTFTDAGIVNSSELTGTALEVGFVNRSGEFEPATARFTKEQVYEGLVHAMSREPDRVWPERYQRMLKQISAAITNDDNPLGIR